MLRDPSKPIHPKLAGVEASMQKYYRRLETTRKRKRPAMRERAEQQALCRFLDANGIGYCSIPNEARRSYHLAAVLKSTGMRAGSPDLILWKLATDNRPIAVELKAADGKVQDTQAAVHEAMREEGWHVVVAFGFEDAALKLRPLYGWRP